MAEKLFSERSGIIPEKSLQIDNIDQELRIRIWNIIFISYFHPIFALEKELSILTIVEIWKDFLKRPIDKMPSPSDSNTYKDIFFSLRWYRIYDLLEFIVEYENQNNDPRIP